MNTKQFWDAMNHLDDATLQEAIDYRPAARGTHLRRGLVGVLAAVMGLLLMGSAAAAALNGGVQAWFQRTWALFTGQGMSEIQTVMLDSLSQPLGLSQTVGGVTVTLDSAAVESTVGVSQFVLLLRASGESLTSEQEYGFRYFDMNIDPQPFETSTTATWCCMEYPPYRAEGEMVMLLRYCCEDPLRRTADTRPLQIELTLEDFMCAPIEAEQDAMVAGTWSFSFTLDRSAPTEVISLPNATVEASIDEPGNGSENFNLEISNVALTSMGLSFLCDHVPMEKELFFGGVSAILKNGVVFANDEAIQMNHGLGETCLSNTCQWSVPIPLDEIEAVCIGNTRIEVP